MPKYKIIDGSWRTGLFSVVTVFLENYLLKKQDENFLVYLGPEYPYFDKKWGWNVWEYYFTQPETELSLDLVLKKPEIYELGFLFSRLDLLDIRNRQDSYYETIKAVAPFIGTVFDFSERAKSELKGFSEAYFPAGKVLGVHRRATDFAQHGRILPTKLFFESVDQYVQQEYKIFLATDSQKSLGEFRKRYGSHLSYIPMWRSRTNRSMHHNNPFWQSPGKLGMLALADSVLLSKCDTLIRTRSNLTTFSSILNPDINIIELDKDIKYK